jgi:cell division protein DivIC
MAGSVLVSFIGTGRKARGEEATEYEKTLYKFPDGSEVETSLITSALVGKFNPQKVIVIGTTKSAWSELSKIDPERLESSQIYERVWDEVFHRGFIEEGTLKEWERFLSDQTGIEFSLNLVGESSTDDIVEVLYREIPKGANKVYMDITHAFRHFPMVASFTLPPLSFLKEFADVELIYALFSQTPPSEVVFLKLVDELTELLKALALAEYGGNFERLGSFFSPSLKGEIENLYLVVETNRRISPQRLRRVIARIEEEMKDNIVKRIAGEYLINTFEELIDDHVALRMAKRAVLAAKRGQFLKAYTLMFEAFIRTQTGSTPSERRDKVYDALWKLGKKEYYTFDYIRQLRNAIAHGSEENLNGELRKALDDKNLLERLIEAGYETLKKLLES